MLDKLIEKKFLDLLPCTVYWKDIQGVYQGCNQKMLDTLGLKSINDFIGKNAFDLLEKSSAEKINSMDKLVLSTKTPSVKEETVIVNGEERDFISNKIPLIKNNQIVGLLGVSFEITEYKAQEREALKQKLLAEDTLNKIINLLPGHVYWYGIEGTIYGMNNQQAQSLGFNSAKEVIGKNSYNLVPEKYAENWRKNNEKVVTTEKVIEAEELFYYPDGHEGTVFSTKAPWYNEKGKPIGVIGVSLDITKQKKLESILSEQKNNAEGTLLHIINMLPGNVYWQDKNDVILGCNLNQALAVGFNDPSEMIGKTNHDMPWKDIADEVVARNRSVMETGEAITFEEAGTMPDGHIATYLSKKAPLRNDDGEVIGIIGISFDITEQKEAERIKLEKAMIEEKLKIAKIQAASIAHELRTPLGAITFLGGTMAEMVPDLLKAYQLATEAGLMESTIEPHYLDAFKEMPEDLARIAKGANTFIDMLLMKVNLENKYARAEDLQTFLLGPVITEALRMYPFAEAYPRSGVKFDAVNDFYVRADALFIRHIMFNLLKNAIHYVLKANKGEIYIWMEQGEESNTLHFKDTGSGMSPHVLEHVFDHFFTETHHGTGVGLALCSMFMEEFDGTISCDSVEGEYTHFKMSFPKATIDALEKK